MRIIDLTADDLNDGIKVEKSKSFARSHFWGE